MGFKVFSDDLAKIQFTNFSTPKTLNTISPFSYGVSTKDLDFKQALLNTDFLTLDGVYFALSSILMKGRNIKRNQGMDVFHHFMKELNEMDGKAFFLGTTNFTLSKIRERCKKDYPNIIFDSFSPPFKTNFSRNDNDKMVKAINSFKPHIVFVSLSAPKQEKWVYLNYSRLNTNLICSIGAVFDWYAGNYKEVAKFWWKLRLVWLIRAIQRPKLLKRNGLYNFIFLKDLFLTRLYLKSHKIPVDSKTIRK